MKDRYQITGYDITSDPQFWIDYYGITPALRREMPRLEEHAVDGAVSAVGKFLELIEKHPQVPQLKNLLSALYANSGQLDKAEEMNRWIETEHPDYLFAKLNKAAVHYHKGEFEKMPQVLGEMMELKAMYPDRETFFISEFMGFNKMAALYFVATGDFEQAQTRLDIMTEVEPDHPDIEQVNDALFYTLRQKAVARYAEEEEKRITPETQGRPVPPQRSEAPVLKNVECYKLMSRGWDLTEEEIQELLGLPRESFVADLELLLEDAQFRFHYFQELFEEEEFDIHSNFPIHAMLFLGELKAEESLPAILDFLRYENEFIRFWLGDTLTEILWQVIYKTGERQPEKLRDFLLEPQLETFCKSPVSQALSQIALHQPERRAEIIKIYRDVLNGFARTEPGDGLLDSLAVGFMLGDLLDIIARELEPEMKKLYELGYVDVGVCGPWEDVELSLKTEETNLHDVLSLREQYKWLQELSGNWDEGPGPLFGEDEDDFLPWMDAEYTPASGFNTPIVKPKKVGRNEPCPCGSGKKHKKCCG